MPTLEDRGNIPVVANQPPVHAWKANLSEDIEHGMWVSMADAVTRLYQELKNRGVDEREARLVASAWGQD